MVIEECTLRDRECVLCYECAQFNFETIWLGHEFNCLSCDWQLITKEWDKHPDICPKCSGKIGFTLYG